MLLRLAVTAKEFHSKPSSYLCGLSDYEAFCLDEACAHMLIHMREKAREDAEKTVGRSTDRKGVSLDWLMDKQAEFKAQGKYDI